MNSASMIHPHYKGLATKGEAEKWFASAPATPIRAAAAAQFVLALAKKTIFIVETGAP